LKRINVGLPHTARKFSSAEVLVPNAGAVCYYCGTYLALARPNSKKVLDETYTVSIKHEQKVVTYMRFIEW